MREQDRLERALETIDESKRSSLRKLLVGAAFVPPVVASFAVNGMIVTSAQAAPASSNMTSNF
jgi:hypothetical protein